MFSPNQAILQQPKCTGLLPSNWPSLPMQNCSGQLPCILRDSDTNTNAPTSQCPTTPHHGPPRWKKLKCPLTTPELLNVECDKWATKLNNMLIDPPTPHHLLLPASYPHLQLSQQTIIHQLQSNLREAATWPAYHQYLGDKYSWTANEHDQIQWHTFHIAYNWFNKQEQKTIAKFNHNWLPLQTSHHIHSTSEQQFCPLCCGHQETANHFLQCPQIARQKHWNDYTKQIQKYLIHNLVPHDFQELLLMGLHLSCNSETNISQHLHQNPHLTSIIKQQSNIGWWHLLHGCTALVWHDHMSQHTP